MAKARTVEVPSDDGIVTLEMTNLEWSLQYVKLKIQEMVRRAGPDSLSRLSPDSISPQIYNGRKTDQCGVVVFGTPGGPHCCFMLRSPAHLTSRLRDPEHPQ